MNISHPLFWQFVWFFSMDEADQASLIGRVEEQWFIEENETNAGANYLIGVCLAFFEISPPQLDQALEQQVHKLRHAVNDLAQDLDPANWAFHTLSKSDGWHSARSLATALIKDSNTLIHPAKKPFKIEDIIHVDHFAHASIVREALRKGSRTASSRRRDSGRRRA